MSARRRGLARGLSIAVATACLGCTFGEAPPPAVEKDLPPTARAQRGPFRVTVNEVGVLEARKSWSVQAPNWGKVDKVVDEGTLVQAGDPVLWLDTEQVERRLERAEADVRDARSNLDKQLENIALQRKRIELDLRRTRATAEFQARKLDNTREAAEDAQRRFARELISEKALLDAQRALRHAEFEHEQAALQQARQEADVLSQERQLQAQAREAERRYAWQVMRRDRFEREVDEAVLRAPAAGEVFLPKLMVRGASKPRKVRAGDRVGRWMGGLIELPDKTSMHVRSQVDEVLISRVGVGVPAVVRVPAVGEIEVAGRVASVALLAVPRSQSVGAGFAEARNEREEQVVFPLTVELDRVDPRLQPGMTVSVAFVLETVEDAVTVPRDAVLGGASEPVVFLKEGDGYESRPVRLGPTSGERVVVEQGLEGGEEVFLGDPRRLVASRGATSPVRLGALAGVGR